MAGLKWAIPVAFALIAVQSTASVAEPMIGNATAAKNRVEGIVGGRAETISTGTGVYSNEVVRTAPNGAADLKFVDDTNLSIGPTSEIVLDKFVYDPTGSSGAVVIQATRGAFRFVTGKQDKKAYQIKTPYGTIGVRGTVLDIVLIPCIPGVRKEDCGLKVKLIEGAADIQTPNGNINLNETNNTVSINGNGVASAGDITGSIGPAAGGGGGVGGPANAVSP